MWTFARHNLQVKLKQLKEKCFRAAKESAAESPERAREMDGFVRKSYADEPRKMAEWEEVMRRWEDGDLDQSQMHTDR